MENPDRTYAVGDFTPTLTLPLRGRGQIFNCVSLVPIQTKGERGRWNTGSWAARAI